MSQNLDIIYAAIENHIQDATGQSVVLVDESTKVLDNNPFETVDSLAAHLDGVLS
ncbi:MAG: hypothetical protein ACPGQM_02130 [Alphaproteobacteria bacterium]